MYFTVNCNCNVENLYARCLVLNSQGNIITKMYTVEFTCLSSIPLFDLLVQSSSVTARPIVMESVNLKKKAGCVRQENACVSMQDGQIISDAMQYDLATFTSQVRESHS